jgi:alkanesulfonate monooxygenase SsuD/methylene tetrahydromethanopterin reductase-like flavin-dependent oxidoreductase (luciferase family)
MSFDQVLANDMALIGGPATVADAIRRIAGQVDLQGLALVFKLGAMPYAMVERSLAAFGAEVMPRIRDLLGG